MLHRIFYHFLSYIHGWLKINESRRRQIKDQIVALSLTSSSTMVNISSLNFLYQFSFELIKFNRGVLLIFHFSASFCLFRAATALKLPPSKSISEKLICPGGCLFLLVSASVLLLFHFLVLKESNHLLALD